MLQSRFEPDCLILTILFIFILKGVLKLPLLLASSCPESIPLELVAKELLHFYLGSLIASHDQNQTYPLVDIQRDFLFFQLSTQVFQYYYKCFYIPSIK